MMHLALIPCTILCSIILGAIVTLKRNAKTETEAGSQVPAMESALDCGRRESMATARTPVDGELIVNTSRPEFIPIKVPFLCNTIPYDNLGFWNFPARMGWEVHREDRWCHRKCPPGICQVNGVQKPYGLARPAVTKKGASSISTREKIAFLQAWLFFGALDQVCALCGLDLEEDITKAFVVDGMVTTQPLNGLSRELYRASLIHWSGWAGVWKCLMAELFKIARYVKLIITRPAKEDEHEYTFEECLVLSSINITLRTILITILHFIPPRALWKEEKPNASYLTDFITWLPEGQRTTQTLLKKQPLPHGWCSISELEGLDSDMKFFAYFLERPHALRDHSNCTETRCLASQTDSKTYRTAHVSDACNCNFVAADPEKLKNSLERNKIPKIMVSMDLDDATDTIALSIVDEEELPYIAISHVWADGLGNPWKNSLPQCQLRRLRDLVNNLGNVIHRDKTQKSPIAFWIDTLCIPVGPHLRHYRTLAIHQIRETFRDATATLVLDKELYYLDSRRASDLEIGIRIFCGGWSKRIWTLKEAVYTLATSDDEKLFFQMREDLVEWDRRRDKFKYHFVRKNLFHEDERTFIWDEDDDFGGTRLEILFETYIETAMEGRLPSLRSLMNSTQYSSQLLRLADAVNKRSTSKPEDEPLCLTFLLGRSAQNLLKTQDVEDRMAMFYLELGKIPISVLFEETYAPDDVESKRKPWTKCNLLKNSPFRWAPASLASLSINRLQSIRLTNPYRRNDFFDWGTCEKDGLHIRKDGFLVTGKEPNLGQPSSFLRDTNTGEIHKFISYKEPVYEHHSEIGILFPLEPENNIVPILQIEDFRVISEDNQDTCAYEYYGTIIGYGKIIRDWLCPDLEKLEDAHILNGRMLDIDQRWCIT